MACLDTLTAYIRDQQVDFVLQQHPQAFTAREVAASEHLPPFMMAKVVIVMANEMPIMLVLPATHQVDMELLSAALGIYDLRLAEEPELARLFPDCQVGAMPPFGNLYGVPVYVAPELTAQERIVFQAGTHTETIGMAYADFARLAQPKVADFARQLRELAAPEW